MAAAASVPGPITADAPAASAMTFTGAQVNAQPFSRPAEALEIVPGLIITQHSGEGKANQYFLRGFQLDHGTDLALFLDGMPLNMRTHGHGQGYADLNFLMPELLNTLEVKKGPYYADEGDFASAGTIRMTYVDRLPKSLFSVTAGSFDYKRLFGAKSFSLGPGDLLMAAEGAVYNGPWVRPDEMRKINAVAKWTEGTRDNGFTVTGMAYANRWYSTDQVPQRAIDIGLIPRNGTLDPSDGGNTSRFSLSARWAQSDATTATKVEAYVVHSSLNLFNDFTYNLGQPDIGDQFRQFDRRTLAGVDARHAIRYDLSGIPTETRFGVQTRYDGIRVGLENTFARLPYLTVRNDFVAEGSVGAWTDTTFRWTPWLRTTIGGRVDTYVARVNGVPDIAYVQPVAWLNSGTSRATLFSPKAGVVFGPFAETELFLNAGRGFHSNDARGTTALFDPNDGSPVQRAPLLVKSQGAEIGLRTRIVPGLVSSASLFMLDFDSENQFEGDTGGTVPGRASRRVGVEWSNHFQPVSWLRADVDVAMTRARSRGYDFAQVQPWIDLAGFPQAQIGSAPGNFIPEAPQFILSAGLELGEATGWFGGVKYRYLGARPLTEDGAFRSTPTGLLNARAGYRFENGLKLQLDAFNVLNTRADQITYAYGSFIKTDALFASCLAGGAPSAVCANGVMDRVLHPVEPLAVRVMLAGVF